MQLLRILLLNIIFVILDLATSVAVFPWKLSLGEKNKAGI